MLLVRRPTGWPQPSDFQLRVRSVERQPQEVLVRNLFISVDPYMRGRMNDRPSYVPPFQLDEPMTGAAVGRVVSGGGDLQRGDHVLHHLGWRDWASGPPAAFQRFDPAPGIALSAYLGALGMPGLTAYVGLLRVAALKPGETVFVSAAAGAVGGMVGQLARLHGAARVIGSAGSDRKVQHLLDRRGFDAAFNYHCDDLVEQLRLASAGQPIDVYFDNVGGAQLEAAISLLNQHGRVAMCGAISQYNATGPEVGIRNLPLAIGRRLRLEGFLVGDHSDLAPAFRNEVEPQVAAGAIPVDETVVDGLEASPQAFIGMLRGDGVGKMVVRIPE